MPLVAELFAQFADIQLLAGRDIKRQHLMDADVLLVRSVTRVDRALLEGTKIKFVGSATIGTDHIDLDYLRQEAVQFAHAPGCNAEAVVQYDLSVICRLMPEWQSKTVGIIGCGNVGGRLYSKLCELNVDCLVYDPFLSPTAIADLAELDRAESEKKTEMAKDDLGNKPQEIKEKIVEGRIQKRLKEMVLIDQPFIRDSNITIEELVKQNIATLGENIQIRRFERFVLGEGLQKKEENFSDEVEKMLKK